MSKMSEMHVELSQQAYDMGYQSLEEAMQMGCTVDMINERLIPSEESAHNAFLEEKKMLLEELENLHDYFVEDDDLHYSIVVAKTIAFIKENVK